jgi:hypothetical protein
MYLGSPCHKSVGAYLEPPLPPPLYVMLRSETLEREITPPRGTKEGEGAV